MLKNFTIIFKPKFQVAVFCLVLFLLCFLNYKVTNAEQSKNIIDCNNKKSVVSYAEQFGLEISYPETEVVEVTIPSNFNDVYQNYNRLQKKQGFDLESFKGKKVKRYTYKIKKYKNETDVFLNLLVLPDGRVIGGDVCSHRFNGFMDVFRKE